MESPPDPRHLVLREERFDVGTERDGIDVATVAVDVESRQVTHAIPIVVERCDVVTQDVTHEAVRLADAIDEPQFLRIQLSRETLDVRKVTVVHEVVAIGKRRVVEDHAIVASRRRDVLDVRTNPSSNEATS